MSEKSLTSLRLPAIVALATIAVSWAALPAVANAAAADVAAGKQLFQEKTCTACHTVGQGNRVGPDLKGVTATRSRQWLEEWIAAPSAMLAKKDPTAVALLHEFHDVPMPDLGLSKPDIDKIISYLETTAPGGSAASAPAAETASAPALQGNVGVGRNLFTGATRFHNGGPPCIACHSTAGIGVLGGGRLGPDLTNVAQRYGGATGIDAFVGGLPTPTMKAVWAKQPLTDQERANVASFLVEAGVNNRPTNEIGQLALLTILGTVILLGIGAYVWRNRLEFGVRRPMMSTPTTGRDEGPYQGGWFPGKYPGGWIARFAGKDTRRGSEKTRRRRS